MTAINRNEFIFCCIATFMWAFMMGIVATHLAPVIQRFERIAVDEHRKAVIAKIDAALAIQHEEPGRVRFCSCKASSRDGQHMAWCTSLSHKKD